MKTSGYGQTLSKIAERAASAIVARGHIRSDAARRMLLRCLASEPGHRDSLIATPVYEAARIWESAESDMQTLSGGLLRADLVDALDRAGEEAIPKDRHPYWHQHEAWKAAAAGKSYMVTSGTGSGKTECFMVPMLNDLLNEAETGARHGVRGLILYPLNALIDSQRERLASWIAPFDGKISYALYNGDTPETRNPHTRPAPAEIGDRKTLRKTPANLLVTNVTMLEYMLTRAQDRGILEQSQGQLRWIVLDEAHTYVGAQAAEMALLLRRVRQAFGVKPEDVRLVATSATIGEGKETVEALRRFVASLGGVAEEQVEIIMGREEPMVLPPEGPDSAIEPEAISDLGPAALWEKLATHPRARKARADIREGGARLSNLAGILAPERGGKQTPLRKGSSTLWHRRGLRRIRRPSHHGGSMRSNVRRRDSGPASIRIAHAERLNFEPTTATGLSVRSISFSTNVVPSRAALQSSNSGVAANVERLGLWPTTNLVLRDDCYRQPTIPRRMISDSTSNRMTSQKSHPQAKASSSVPPSGRRNPYSCAMLMQSSAMW